MYASISASSSSWVLGAFLCIGSCPLRRSPPLRLPPDGPPRLKWIFNPNVSMEIHLLSGKYLRRAWSGSSKTTRSGRYTGRIGSYDELYFHRFVVQCAVMIFANSELCVPRPSEDDCCYSFGPALSVIIQLSRPYGTYASRPLAST